MLTGSSRFTLNFVLNYMPHAQFTRWRNTMRNHYPKRAGDDATRLNTLRQLSRLAVSITGAGADSLSPRRITNW